MEGPLLRIVLDRVGSSSHEFTIIYQANGTSLTATARVDHVFVRQQEESLRWYLEEYRKFPFEPAITIAKKTAADLKLIGEQLFDQLFNRSDEARTLWALAEENLEATRIEIDADPVRFAVPWELLWNPLEAKPVVYRVGSFVRSGLSVSAPPSSNPTNLIRVLLVVSRPAGVRDAPFRSIAARLLERVGQDSRFRFEVLRPSTFEAFQQALQSGVEQGSPYSIVHFDGHGVHEDLIALRENRPARRRRGYLLFESPFDPNQPDFIDAPSIGEALASGGAPILILNACRSARTEIWTEEMGGRRPIGSLADELMRFGQSTVVAMQYNVDVDTASRFVADLYQGLATHGSLAKAVQDGRRGLFQIPDLEECESYLKIDDWLVPVLFEAFPRTVGLDQGVTPQNPGAPATLFNTTVGGDDILMAIERAFQSAPTVVLSGPVGSGKTTIAAEFVLWDERTRDESNRARSPIHLRDENATDVAQLVNNGGRVLIETRDPRFTPLLEHVAVRMAPLEMAERITLFHRHGPRATPFDPELWRSVLVFSQGNPAVINSLAAITANTPEALPAPILEACRSLPVGLDLAAVTAELFTLDTGDLDCLVISTLFEGTVSTRTLRLLASAASESKPLKEDADALFDRISSLGLATPVGSSYYLMHPGLPGLLQPEFDRRYPGDLGMRVRRAMVTFISAICVVFYRHGDSGKRDAYEVQSRTLGLIEPTVRRTLDGAILAERWSDVRNCCAALRRLLTQQGRRLEWRRLASQIQTLVPSDTKGNPLPGREGLSYFMQQDHIEGLVRTHSLTEAVWLQERLLAQLRLDRERTEPAAADEFAKELLMPELRRLGDIRMEQRDPDASRYYLEALQIAQRLQSEPDEQRISAQLAGFYLSQEPPDWNESLYWLTYAAELCRPYDRICQAQIKILQGASAMAQSQPAGAIEHYQAALSGLLPADPSDERAECELKLALALSANRADLSETMQHVQSAIAWYDEDQNVYRASRARFAAAKILFESGENNRASAYAEEAARGFATLAPHAEKDALAAARFVSGLDISKAIPN